MAFTTISGVPVDEVYTPESIRDLDYAHDLGNPGQPPYTRGIHENMYRGKLWTMRQFSGFGTAEETNHDDLSHLNEPVQVLVKAYSL